MTSEDIIKLNQEVQASWTLNTQNVLYKVFNQYKWDWIIGLFSLFTILFLGDINSDPYVSYVCNTLAIWIACIVVLIGFFMAIIHRLAEEKEQQLADEFNITVQQLKENIHE